MSLLKRCFGPNFINKSVRSLRQYSAVSKVTPAEIDERVLNILKAFDKVDPTKVTLDSDLEKDLGLDSLDKVEVMVALEEEFGQEVPDDIADSARRLSDVASYFKGGESHTH